MEIHSGKFPRSPLEPSGLHDARSGWTREAGSLAGEFVEEVDERKGGAAQDDRLVFPYGTFYSRRQGFKFDDSVPDIKRACLGAGVLDEELEHQ